MSKNSDFYRLIRQTLKIIREKYPDREISLYKIDEERCDVTFRFSKKPLQKVKNHPQKS